MQKVRTGGTVTKAPIGYRNVSRTDDLSRVERTVEVDTERARHITSAFLQYAGGELSAPQVLDELTSRGLTTRPTPPLAAKPLSPSLHKVLHNPCCKGIVTYRGVECPSLHQPLIDPETWQRVQVAGRQQPGR